MRPLCDIALDALNDPTLKGSTRMYSVGYLDALTYLNGADEYYGCDSGESMVLYALSNLSNWRGESARTIKAELRKHVGAK